LSTIAVTAIVAELAIREVRSANRVMFIPSVRAATGRSDVL
jgi:hypothetical protein